MLVHRASSEQRAKLICAATVAIDLGVLGVYKYYGFFVDEFSGLLEGIGIGATTPVLNLALPIGLSFYTFQAISYIVDVKRGELEPAPTIDVAIYLSFFPHVVAGPIVRAKEFLPQLTTPRDRNDVAVGAAVVLIAIGLVKKVAIADFLAREVVDDVFAVPQQYDAPDVILAAYAYTAQIYCDFSGYTDIAIGVALLMGFVFPRQLQQPIPRAQLPRVLAALAHHALPLPARLPLHPARRQPRRALEDGPQPDDHDAARRALARRGVGLRAVGRRCTARRSVIERALRGRVPAPPVWARWFIVFHVVVFGWILFRSETLSRAADFLGQLAEPGPATLWSFPVVLAIVAVIGLQLLPERPLERLRIRAADLRPAVLGPALAVTVAMVSATVPSQAVPPFIYFQF